jgi:hypothetical protein
VILRASCSAAASSRGTPKWMIGLGGSKSAAGGASRAAPSSGVDVRACRRSRRPDATEHGTAGIRSAYRIRQDRRGRTCAGGRPVHRRAGRAPGPLVELTPWPPLPACGPAYSHVTASVRGEVMRWSFKRWTGWGRRSCRPVPDRWSAPRARPKAGGGLLSAQRSRCNGCERGAARGRPRVGTGRVLRLIQGVGSENEPPKMSVLPKVAGQSFCGSGWAMGLPAWTEARQASIAGQSEALRASFHTATP